MKGVCLSIKQVMCLETDAKQSLWRARENTWIFMNHDVLLYIGLNPKQRRACMNVYILSGLSNTFYNTHDIKHAWAKQS